MKALLSLLVLSGTLVHCAPNPSNGDGGPSYPLTLYTPASDGGLLAMDASTQLELRLGFQSFVMGRIAFELPNDAPSLRSARLVLRVQNETPAMQNVSGLEYECESCPRKRTPPILLFANDLSPSAVAGRPFELEATVFDERGTARTRVSGTIRWDPNCIEAADGTCLPPDGGLSDGGEQ